MYYKLFRIIVALLVFVADQWLYGEALQKSPVTRKYERDYRRCDTFFHTRTINGEKVRPIWNDCTAQCDVGPYHTYSRSRI